MRGYDVRKVQSRLVGNKYKKFYSGNIDGEWGPKSAAATKSAKYWLGYPRRKINSRLGEKLYRYLGDTPLPVTYKIRRKTRLRANRISQREKALLIAKKELGIKEFPYGSNIVKYSTWYGLNGPWCAMFITWCYAQAGNKNTFKRGSNYAYCPFIVNDARAERNGLRTVSKPIPGDLVLYDWDGGVSDHIGIFERWVTPGSSFLAIEGNTSLGNQSNGGQVMRRLRFQSQVEIFARVQAG